MDDDGLGSGDGACWERAHDSLDAALAVAEPGTQIWVAQGSYSPGSTSDATFALPDEVSIYGGFDGSEETLAQRLMPSGSTLQGAPADGPVRAHIATARGVSGSVLDGFTITGGDNSKDSTAMHGSALIIENADITLRNVVVRDNVGIDNGALWILKSTVTVENGLFERNKARTYWNEIAGGAIRADRSVLHLSRTTFRENEASVGAALRLIETEATIDLSVFEDNVKAYYGTAIYMERASRVSMRHSRLSDNAAFWSGGAIRTDRSHLWLDDILIDGNSVSWSGGGLESWESIVEGSRVRFLDNHAADEGYNHGGGGALLSRSVARLDGVSFTGNVSEYKGGAQYVVDSLVTLTDAWFADNDSTNAWYEDDTDTMHTSGAMLAVDITTTTPLSVDDLAPGDLFITEIMAKPTTTGSTKGEWFEISVDAGSPVDLSGLVIQDGDGNTATLSESLVVYAGEHVVLGAGSVADWPSQGVLPLAVYGTAITLADSAPKIQISNARGVLDAIEGAAATSSISQEAIQPNNDDATDWVASSCRVADSAQLATPGRAMDVCDLP